MENTSQERRALAQPQLPANPCTTTLVSRWEKNPLFFLDSSLGMNIQWTENSLKPHSLFCFFLHHNWVWTTVSHSVELSLQQRESKLNLELEWDTKLLVRVFLGESLLVQWSKGAKTKGIAQAVFLLCVVLGFSGRITSITMGSQVLHGRTPIFLTVCHCFQDRVEGLNGEGTILYRQCCVFYHSNFFYTKASSKPKSVLFG